MSYASTPIGEKRETDNVEKLDGDFADLVAYFTGLFGIKKIPEISMDHYSIMYKSTVVLQGMTGDSEYTTTGYPEKTEREAAKTINLEITGLIAPDASCLVSINWDWITFHPEVEDRTGEAFVDRLDQATFRFF